MLQPPLRGVVHQWLHFVVCTKGVLVAIGALSVKLILPAIPIGLPLSVIGWIGYDFGLDFVVYGLVLRVLNQGSPILLK